jgi:hypothetical protein
VRSLASISSCVSKRVKAPGLVAAGLNAALVRAGLPEDAHLVVLAGHLVIALRAAASRFRQGPDDGSLVRGFAANRLTVRFVKLDRTRYFAISTPSAAGP